MKQWLPFKVGYETYALNLVDIQEVVERTEIYPFPGSPAVVAGAIAVHGRIVPVIDLPQLLRFSHGKIGQRLIVLINEYGPIALGVDQVGAIIHLEQARTSRMEDYAERPFIRDVVNWGGEMISLFDLENLRLVLEQQCQRVGG
jgi:purine-binding chemotaxis protein CheW